jgi:hypothetical protein
MQNIHRALTIAAVAVLACAGQDGAQEKVEYRVFGEYVQPEDSFPTVRYFETALVAPNDRCAVRKTKLNTKMPPVYVNGTPIGFC